MKMLYKKLQSVGKALSDAVIMAGNAVKFLHDNFETIKALAIGVVVFKISKSFSFGCICKKSWVSYVGNVKNI